MNRKLEVLKDLGENNACTQGIKNFENYENYSTFSVFQRAKSTIKCLLKNLT